MQKPQKHLALPCQEILQKANIKLDRKCLLLIISSILCLTTYNHPAIAQTQIPGNPGIKTQPIVKGAIANGNQISLNGRILPGAWLQRQAGKNQITTHIGDGSLQQLIGIELLDTNVPTKQPINWFSPKAKPQILTAQLAGSYRYLDITNLAKTAGWQIQLQGNILNITTPQTKITNIREASYIATMQMLVKNEKPLAPEQVSKAKIVTINLDRPTPWQVRQELPVKRVVDPDAVNPQPTAPPNREWTIILDGIADPALIQRYTPVTSPLIPQPNPLQQLPVPPITPTPQPDTTVTQVEVVNNQTLIRVSVPFGFAPRIQSTSNPSVLNVEIRPDALLPRNITWTPGLRWRQQWVNLGQDSFPIVSLEANPRNLQLKPIVSNSDTLIGTAPWIQTAQKYLAVAGINGGFFNRNNRYPLGAIRSHGKWLSSPILNRGAIAWNDSGQFYVGRLTLGETLVIKEDNPTLSRMPMNSEQPILFLNSGYVQSGLARYTPAWGQTYTPLTDNESIIVVENNKITQQLSAGKANENPIPIPTSGYLLTIRGKAPSNFTFPIGANVSIKSGTIPADFNRYPHIIGAGPLLVQNRQVVLDAKAEKFSDAFIREKAIRSAICTTANGNVIIASTHNRAGGAGPTLAENARLMQQMGCINALNLDGGSSTSLYLGGQLIDRSPSTAARVHNGIGIFLKK
ncbi:phosphodiester glycosidase family protein [Calothrix sp. UHCC 0171]|uniref:phosphodiester glycosidase family protein n=1 Tax=Calothrix sp. UHCC 0171 TaxID=3110245 RepID=UPI002B1F7C3A|nr:phosphodiester glycosidase family protein [Calothrix sp. UHCC 0171]MEA5570237.1 phosphodiester glycosidase family protein [Calothrix sp. UHCC 0171]